MSERPRPPFDPELEAVLATMAAVRPPTITPHMLSAMRDRPRASLSDVIGERAVVSRDAVISGFRGDEITVTVIQRADHVAAGPAVVHFHGGGMIMGNRFVGIVDMVDWVERFDAVCVTVEYRLAPENPDPYPIEDCYSALVWTAEQATELGIDRSRILVAGNSAGGGLAAGVALLARDRSGPDLIGQVLIYPMLDDRDSTISAQQIAGIGVWDRTSNLTGWNALLGDRRGGDEVSIYAAPSRATDLSRLPPAYIDCGSAEVFRDEDVAYATALWQAGVQAELHVWPGGFHGFDMIAPRAKLSRLMVEARTNWVSRLLTH